MLNFSTILYHFLLFRFYYNQSLFQSFSSCPDVNFPGGCFGSDYCQANSLIRFFHWLLKA